MYEIHVFILMNIAEHTRAVADLEFPGGRAGANLLFGKILPKTA